LPDSFPQHAEQWLISFPLLGSSHIFQQGGFISYGYMEEKLGRDRFGFKVCPTDLHEMSKLVALIAGKEHDAATDDKGELKHLRAL